MRTNGKSALLAPFHYNAGKEEDVMVYQPAERGNAGINNRIGARRRAHKGKKPGGALVSPVARLPSPLRCLTSVFGMGTGVPTAPSPPDLFPSFFVAYALWKPDTSQTCPEQLFNT